MAARLDRGEDIGEREALVAQARRALTAPPPDVTGPPLLSNARLVPGSSPGQALEEQADAFFMCMLKFSQKLRSSFKGRLSGRVFFRVARPCLLS